MSCHTFQHDLSQCLDGRLPSGRRQVVMDHVASCDACSQFWTELQSAQELVLRLPRQRVSRDFREQLFERIETGEGTPSAVFGEPVPLMNKVRYVLTGAAAAAAVLVVFTMARRDFGATSSGRSGQDLAALDSRPDTSRQDTRAQDTRTQDTRAQGRAEADAEPDATVHDAPPSPQGVEA